LGSKSNFASIRYADCPPYQTQNAVKGFDRLSPNGLMKPATLPPSPLFSVSDIKRAQHKDSTIQHGRRNQTLN